MAMNEDLLRSAVQNNADLCDSVCRANGLAPQRTPMAWTSATRTPSFYPDAITLAADVDAESILSLIDRSPGCSIKDSFAALDLHPYGFSILIEATWIGFPAGPVYTNRVEAGSIWTSVDSASEFRDWVTAWRRTNAFSESAQGPGPDALIPALLDDPVISFIWAREEDKILAGAMVNRSVDAVGLLNFFTTGLKTSDTLKDCLGYIQAVSPNQPLVGYLENSSLRFAGAAGFQFLGPLRIWVN